MSVPCTSWLVSMWKRSRLEKSSQWCVSRRPRKPPSCGTESSTANAMAVTTVPAIAPTGTSVRVERNMAIAASPMQVEEDVTADAGRSQQTIGERHGVARQQRHAVRAEQCDAKDHADAGDEQDRGGDVGEHGHAS